MFLITTHDDLANLRRRRLTRVFFSESTPTLAVEVRRVGWRRLSHVESDVEPWREDEEGNWIRGDLVELNLDLCVDEPAHRDKGSPKKAGQVTSTRSRKTAKNSTGRALLAAKWRR